MRGSGVFECKMGSEFGVWEGMEGRSGAFGRVWRGEVVRSVIKEGSREIGKEGCTLLMSEQIWKGLEECRWKGTRIVWAKTKVGIVK